MASLTGYKILTDTVPNEDDGLRTRISDGGNVRGRRAFDEALIQMTVRVAVNPTEKTALLAFYAANRDVENDIEIDGVTIDFLFTSKPQTVEKQGPMRIMAFDIAGHPQ